MKTVKKIKPAYKVDLTCVETPNDIFTAYGYTKVGAGYPIEKYELAAIVADAIEVRDLIDETLEYAADAIASMFECPCKKVQKKLPWYKRFWRWITFRK